MKPVLLVWQDVVVVALKIRSFTLLSKYVPSPCCWSLSMKWVYSLRLRFDHHFKDRGDICCLPFIRDFASKRSGYKGGSIQMLLPCRTWPGCYLHLLLFIKHLVQITSRPGVSPLVSSSPWYQWWSSFGLLFVSFIWTFINLSLCLFPFWFSGIWLN